MLASDVVVDIVLECGQAVCSYHLDGPTTTTATMPQLRLVKMECRRTCLRHRMADNDAQPGHLVTTPKSREAGTPLLMRHHSLPPSGLWVSGNCTNTFVSTLGP